MAENLENATKLLKIAEKIVSVIKSENLTDEETMRVLNLIDISLFPEEFDESAIETEFMITTCPCTLLENILFFDVCDGDCGNCKILGESDDFEGCRCDCEDENDKEDEGKHSCTCKNCNCEKSK